MNITSAFIKQCTAADDRMSNVLQIRDNFFSFILQDMIDQLDEQTRKDLLTAFTYEINMDRSFYWKRSAQRVIEVSVFDYFLLMEDEEEDVKYDSGLDADGEQELIEAMKAVEEKLGTHICIPRLEVDERIGWMRDYIYEQDFSPDKVILETNLDDMIALMQDFRAPNVKPGLRPGLWMDDLTHGCEAHQQSWNLFYMKKAEGIVDDWLHRIHKHSS